MLHVIGPKGRSPKTRWYGESGQDLPKIEGSNNNKNTASFTVHTHVPLLFVVTNEGSERRDQISDSSQAEDLFLLFSLCLLAISS